ncbi:MAG TPA: ABC transporter ATP-binding protein [Candidatus Saccharibacteria bacterium]|nr:ABC transporter ATP-binding protein [Candidatus Saccharibacteria bacterium]
MADHIAIKVDNVSKSFRLPHEKNSSLKSAFLSVFHGKHTFEKQEVLNDISFEIKKGEFFGIVGRNGSGKSTLLKLLAGIYEPNKGTIEVKGKLTPFIELGVGFNPELTGRENVFLNGALLGFNRSEMNAMYEEIVDFAELHKFMDQKLKNYSSGMQVRLAFSIAIRAKSDILLIDEVLAVGDSAFQRKCYEHFMKLKKEKQTVVLVTHDMGAVERFCNQVLVIDSGELLGQFKPSDATTAYDRLNVNDEQKSNTNKDRWGTGEVKLKKLHFKKAENEKTTTFKTGEPFELLIELDNPDNKDIVVGLGFEDAFGVNISGPNSIELHMKAPKSVAYRIDNLSLLPGDYKLTVAIYDENVVNEYDHLDKSFTFRVIAAQHGLYGKVNFFGKWDYIK